MVLRSDVIRLDRYRWIVAALFGMSIIWTLLSSSATAGSHGCTKVIRVYDGDTVRVTGPADRLLVRLLGIDAPETAKTRGRPGQPFSARSHRHLTNRVLGRCVTLESYGNDRYGRRLAVIYLKGQNINLEMVTQGLAEAYRGRTPDGFDHQTYRRAEAMAKREGTGMWVQGEAYRSPIDWKHRR